MAINNRDFELRIKNTIESIKKDGCEIDFNLRLLKGLIERIMFYPKFNFSDISYFEKTIFKGFIYSTLTIDDIDYVTIMTASDSLNNPHTVFLIPCLLLNIIKVYKKDEGMSKGPDFSLNVDDKNKKKFNTIDEWVKRIIQASSFRIAFKLRCENNFERHFFMFKVDEYFDYKDEISISDDEFNVVYVERVYSTYQGFLQFLFSSPLIYKNIEIISPSLKEKLEADFGDIINNFDKKEKYFELNKPSFRF